eukprot:620376-Pleurochrysis_carterae.AAC.2
MVRAHNAGTSGHRTLWKGILAESGFTLCDSAEYPDCETMKRPFIWTRHKTQPKPSRHGCVHKGRHRSPARSASPPATFGRPLLVSECFQSRPRLIP